jgi:hypothetical protein
MLKRQPRAISPGTITKQVEAKVPRCYATNCSQFGQAIHIQKIAARAADLIEIKE